MPSRTDGGARGCVRSARLYHCVGAHDDNESKAGKQFITF